MRLLIKTVSVCNLKPETEKPGEYRKGCPVLKSPPRKHEVKRAKDGEIIHDVSFSEDEWHSQQRQFISLNAINEQETFNTHDVVPGMNL